MNFDLTDEQESLRDTLLELFEKASGTPDVRAAEPLGFDESLWGTVADMGIHAIAVDVDHGGGGGGFLELSLAAECAGGALAPIPLVESAVATTLLASLSETEAPDSPSTRATSGASIATLALHPVDDGVARVVPAGAVADYVVALRGSPAPELVVVETGGKRPALANLGSMPVADVDVGGSDATVLATGPAAIEAHGRAVRHWQLLTGAALVGLAGRAIEIGVDYVKGRHAFGTLIANFQSIQHRLADDATSLEGARLLAYEAAWAYDEALANADALALMSFLFATETATRATADSLHFHGGYGYTLEYDIQLYFRRARAWPLVAGDPRKGYASVAHRLGEAEEA